ncbi:PP2C family protein-serine/threonine phosphatase [Anaerostipes sp.]|uniref:PP2C family protein-serine/threonine phosphatase n=1 Tax=Anaerostipes sp. TaxID=1872530 RepID=UPI003FF0FFCC
MLRAVCASGIGMRPTHEDNFLLNGKIIEKEIQQRMPELKMIQYQSVCSKKVNFITVSDGMGGHNAGEIASYYCMKEFAALEEKVQNCISINEVVSRIQQEIVYINSSICEMGNRYVGLYGMGTTLVMLVNYETEYVLLNIGDSRAYGFGKQGLWQISKDHTEGQRMVDLGILTRKEVENFPAKKNLNRYLGYCGIGYQLQADVFELPASTTTVLLCSDGVTDVLNEKKLSDFLNSGASTWNIAEHIVSEACQAVNADNATAIIVELTRR